MLKKAFSALTVMAALGASALLPATALAQDRDHHERDTRMYDRAHKDYHAWNGDEDRMYRQYLSQHHRKYVVFSGTNKKQQEAYWQWRHEHDGR